jgi:hypothetical protein
MSFPFTHAEVFGEDPATMAEVMAVLQICVAQGVQALNQGVPILQEELARAMGDEGAVG